MREVLKHLNYVQEELVTIDEDVEVEEAEEPVILKKELTNEEVFAFLRAKGMTLDSACKSDPEFGEFIASFTTEPEKRMHGDIEPAGGKSIGTDIDELDNPADRFNVTNSLSEAIQAESALFVKNKNNVREMAANISDEHERLQFLLDRSVHDLRLIRDPAIDLLFEFLANRNLDPNLIKQVAEHAPSLVEKLYRYKESDFLIQFKKENGL